jgi:hypothetical protein
MGFLKEQLQTIRKHDPAMKSGAEVLAGAVYFAYFPQAHGYRDSSRRGGG